MDERDIRFMQRALSLARQGIGLASPNPTVGCVIVRDQEIVGEGFHHYNLKDHAEAVALKTGEKRRAAQRCMSRSSLAITPAGPGHARKRFSRREFRVYLRAWRIRILASREAARNA